MISKKDRQTLSRDDLRGLARDTANRDTPLPDPNDLSPPEVAVLLYELDVYKTELKAQNEELLNTLAELQAARESEELALAEAKAALERYQDLYDFAPVGYVTLDGQGRVKEANRAACTLLEIKESTLLGAHPAPFNSFIHPESIHNFNEHLDSICSLFQSIYCEIKMVSSLKRPFHARLESSPVLMDGVIHCRTAMVDITEQIHLQESLREAGEKARVANEAKSIFLANMSHELRTPLTGIKGMLELMRVEQDDKKQNEYLEDTLRLTDHLTWLLSEVLDLSSIEAGGLTFDAAPFQLSSLMHSIRNIFESSARTKGLDFEILLDKNLPQWLEGDRGRIRQLLYNLVGNAVKYTAAGKVTVEAFPLERINGKHHVLFSVSDTGEGIPRERINDMFEPFTQMDGTHSRFHQGAGLGLQIVKRLVLGMTGTINVDSVPGEGTTVYISLPFGACEKPGRVEQDEALDARVNFEGSSILLVEDDPTNCLCTRRLLERMGAEVTCAGNGKEALAALRENIFSCILMDIQMPGMDGLQATETIRTSPDFAAKAHIPIIALTAHAMAGDRSKFIEAGMDEYIPKPVSMDDLLGTLAKVLAH